ncbi:MAG: class I SAM-dependent methyltransferase [Sphingomonas sp.]
MKELARLNLQAGDKVIDLGGTCEIWDFIDTPLDITIVNLPGVDVRRSGASRHQFHFVEGDATDLKQFPDGHFDLVFSNSVIEHVGGEQKERAFAREARRLGRAYYVQTPSIWFPLEAHSGMPFWWALPQAVRKRMIDHWRLRLPDWAGMIEGTTVITRRQLRSYFPDGKIITERVAGIPKSYAVYRAVPSNEKRPGS